MLECAGTVASARRGKRPVRLADVLAAAGVQRGAAEVVFRGADQGTVNGSAATIAFERSLSVADARYAGALLAFAMNDEPLPARHGHPVRLVVPGKYAVASVKWLTGITVTSTRFDGFFQAEHYVFQWPRGGDDARQPVAGPAVRALITSPATGDQLPHAPVRVRGAAWSGAAPVTLVEVSVAEGPWQPATLAALAGQPAPHGWRRWELTVSPPSPGELTIRARATDAAGRTQQAEPEWNRLGYGGNFIHAVTVALR